MPKSFLGCGSTISRRFGISEDMMRAVARIRPVDPAVDVATEVGALKRDQLVLRLQHLPEPVRLRKALRRQPARPARGRRASPAAPASVRVCSRPAPSVQERPASPSRTRARRKARRPCSAAAARPCRASSPAAARSGKMIILRLVPTTAIMSPSAGTQIFASSAPETFSTCLPLRVLATSSLSGDDEAVAGRRSRRASLPLRVVRERS